MVPASRIRTVNHHPVRGSAAYVLYWMIAGRRLSWNFALDRAVEHAASLGLPVLVFEAVEVDHPWAAERFHAFVIDGMRDNREAAQRLGLAYFAYVEPSPGAGRGLLAALARQAAVVVTDDFPCFFLPALVAAAGRALDVRLEAVDNNGLLPVRAFDRAFPTAHAFRRAWQQQIGAHLEYRPRPVAVERGQLPAPAPVAPAIEAQWPSAFSWMDRGGRIEDLPIDHAVPAAPMRGGTSAARRQLQAFLEDGFTRYGDGRNHPDHDAASGLSPYLHWGHLSAHEIFDAVVRREGWLGDTTRRATGAREGWWGLGRHAEAFLDQLVTWRELGYNMTAARPADYHQFDSLPEWARATLDRHAGDPRPTPYDRATLERAATHDRIWNAAQRQLAREGRMHNYLRMLWGKKILEWSATPREALATMIDLNNRYALDGRNPNSYSGIFWTLGRYDRPWFPERPIFGTVRYMSSDNTARKLKLKDYLARYGGDTPGLFDG